jgi:hypothetical protein
VYVLCAVKRERKSEEKVAKIFFQIFISQQNGGQYNFIHKTVTAARFLNADCFDFFCRWYMSNLSIKVIRHLNNFSSLYVIIRPSDPYSLGSLNFAQFSVIRNGQIEEKERAIIMPVATFRYNLYSFYWLWHKNVIQSTMQTFFKGGLKRELWRSIEKLLKSLKTSFLKV